MRPMFVECWLVQPDVFGSAGVHLVVVLSFEKFELS